MKMGCPYSVNVNGGEGGGDGRVVKVLDTQPQDHAFKSCNTLGLLCLEVIVNMQLLAC